MARHSLALHYDAARNPALESLDYRSLPPWNNLHGDASIVAATERRTMERSLQAEIETYLNYCLDQNRSRKTVSTYQQVLQDFAGWLGRHYPRVDGIAKVERPHIQAYARALRLRGVDDGSRRRTGDEVELSVRTRSKYLAVIRSLLKYFAV